MLESSSLRVEEQIKFLEEEVEIRVESLKDELDKLHLKFKENLSNMRHIVLSYKEMFLSYRNTRLFLV